MFLYLSDGCQNKETGILHFLWRDETKPIYIMDEHQGALACWLLELSPTDEYTLFHIDHHWDATDMTEDELQTLAESDPDLDSILNTRIASGQTLVDWTNYLSALQYLRPNLTRAFFAADQDRYDSKLLQDPRVETFQPEELISNLKQLVAGSTGKVLINIDFDFLFHGVGKRAYSDDLLVGLLKSIKSSLGPQMILTAAWTPSLCGGCRPAATICKLFCDALEIKCPTEELPTTPT